MGTRNTIAKRNLQLDSMQQDVLNLTKIHSNPVVGHVSKMLDSPNPKTNVSSDDLDDEFTSFQKAFPSKTVENTPSIFYNLTQPTTIYNTHFDNQPSVVGQTDTNNILPIQSSHQQWHSWLYKQQDLPSIYNKAIRLTIVNNQLDVKQLFYMLLSSGLPNPTLEIIWDEISSVTKSLPNLNPICIALGLIALIQQNPDLCNPSLLRIQISTLTKQLLSLDHPPIPELFIASNQIPATHSTSQPHILLDVHSVSKGDDNFGDLQAFHNASSATVMEPHAGFPVLTLGTSEKSSPPLDCGWADFESASSHHIVASTLDESAPSEQQIQTNVCSNPQTDEIKCNLDVEDAFQDFQACSVTLSAEKALSISNNTQPPLSDSTFVGITSQSPPLPDWLRCLEECRTMLMDSERVLSLLTSDDVIDAFLKTIRGSDFIFELIQIYGVAQRIRLASSLYGILDSDLYTIFKSIDDIWCNLAHFAKLDKHKVVLTKLLNLGSTIGEAAIVDFTQDGFIDKKPCAVCLTTLSPLPPDTSDAEPVIMIVGHSYHSACANLWVNRIQLSLPALLPP